MTARQFVRELVVAKQNRDERRERDIWMAWHIAALSRTQGKDFPKLETLLRKTTPQKRQSPVEQVAAWQVIAAQFGGAFRPMDPAEYAKVIRG